MHTGFLIFLYSHSTIEDETLLPYNVELQRFEQKATYGIHTYFKL